MSDSDFEVSSHSGLRRPARVRFSPWFLLLALLVLAAGLRFHDLADRSLWADELFSASVANDHPLWPTHGMPLFERLRILDVHLGQSFWTVKAADQSPPLFELLGKASIELFGLGEFAVRLPSALAGVLLVAWLGWNALRTGDTRARAVLGWAAVLCALAPGLVAYAQEARVYSVGTLWAGMLATWWFLRWQRGWHSAPLPGWGEISVFVLACYSHNNLILLSAILLTGYGIEALRRRDGWAMLRLAVVPLAYIPWLALSVHTLFFTMNRGIAWTDLGWTGAMLEAFRSLPEVLPAAWLFLLGVVMAARWLVRRTPAGAQGSSQMDGLRGSAMLPLVALTAVVLLYFVLIAAVVSRSGVYHYRHIVFIVPFLALIAGCLLEGLHARWLQVATMVVLAATAAPGLNAAYHRPTSDFRAAYGFALAHVAQRAPIVGITPADRRFYVDVLEPDSQRELIFLSEYTPGAYREACQRLLAAGTGTAVVTHPMREPLVRALFNDCGGHFQVAQRMTGDHVIAEWWRRIDRPAEGSATTKQGD